MAKYSKSCGPNAIDEYDDYYRVQSIEHGTVHYDCSRTHNVSGAGLMESSNGTNAVSTSYSYRDDYYISEGITELGDKCLNTTSITYVTLPQTVEKIGNECFRYSSIIGIVLPESLKEIGHDNFPSSLEQITIPSLIGNFPLDNVAACEHLNKISVNADNKSYKSYKGMLFNYDMTKIIRCPRGIKGQITLPSSVKEIGDHCFDGCAQVTRIILPSTIDYIGDYAFANISIEELIIPNKVKHMGIGCLSRSTFTKQLKLPVSLPIFQMNSFIGQIMPRIALLIVLRL